MSRVSEPGGGTGFPSDSITLKRLDTGVAETAQVDVEYRALDQYGGIYGTVVIQHFGSTLPANLTSGNNVEKLLAAEFHVPSGGGNRQALVALNTDGSNVYALELSGVSGGGNLFITKAGAYVGGHTTGWVTYIKA